MRTRSVYGTASVQSKNIERAPHPILRERAQSKYRTCTFPSVFTGNECDSNIIKYIERAPSVYAVASRAHRSVASFAQPSVRGIAHIGPWHRAHRSVAWCAQRFEASCSHRSGSSAKQALCCLWGRRAAGGARDFQIAPARDFQTPARDFRMPARDFPMPA